MLQLLSPYTPTQRWNQVSTTVKTANKTYPRLNTAPVHTQNNNGKKKYIFLKKSVCYNFTYLISDLEIVWNITHLNVYIVIYTFKALENRNKN